MELEDLDFSFDSLLPSLEKPDTKEQRATELDIPTPTETRRAAERKAEEKEEAASDKKEEAAKKAEAAKPDKPPTSAADALPKEVPAVPPYKVYSTSVIQDETQPSPYRPRPLVSPPVQQEDNSALAAMLRQQLSLEDAPTAPAAQAPSPAMPVVAANALPSQYFPLLPLGALAETQPTYLPLASNIPLSGDHSGVMRAIISIHDINRNASDGLALLTTLSGSDYGATMIMTPQFPLELDIARFADRLPDRGASLARWPLGIDGPSWDVGGNSVGGPREKGISSFTALDLILLYLADRENFSSLRQIVVVGHGVGADFVQRYAAIGQAPDVLESMKLQVRFLVANPSSYLYLTNQRPTSAGRSFAIAKDDDCPQINAYPYGLTNLVPYAKRMGTSTIQMRYPTRRVLYLLGGRITSDPYLDQSCAAKAEGKDRLTRALNFQRYINVTFSDNDENRQSFATVPNAGYDPASLYGSYCGLSVLFGDGSCGSK